MTAALLRELLQGEPLTDREVEVLESTCRGLTHTETGADIYLSPETIKQYRKRIIAKLGARNMTHACVLAIGRGVVNVEPIVEEADS